MERTRAYLRQEFRDGEKPSGADFSDLVDSGLNRLDDGITIDADGNFAVQRGIRLNDTASGAPGTLRFNGGRIQYFDGAAWVNVGEDGGGGAFEEVDGGPNVGFAGGNVGIGNFAAAAPTYRLEVELGTGAGNDNAVRFGTAAVRRGRGAFQNHAQFSHEDHASQTGNYALRQGPNGDVVINAPSGQPIRFAHNHNQTRVHVDATGRLVIGSNNLLPGADNNDILQVNGDAFKTGGNDRWDVASDLRLKEEVQPFADGLDKLKQIRAVTYRYKDSPISQAGKTQVGIIGQEVEQIFPYMVRKVDTQTVEDLPEDTRIYNGSALTYVMVNAIKELSAELDRLKAQLASEGEV